MRLINGSGPTPCGILICGTHPAWQEERTGRVFAGKTGDELDTYLASVGLSRRDVYLTNLYRFYGGSNDYTYTRAEYDAAIAALADEVRRVQPFLVVTLGAEPARYFLHADIDLDDVHSLPWAVDDVTVLPLYHIAHGFHRPEISGKVSYGFQQLGAYLRGEIEPRVLGAETVTEVEYGEATSSAIETLARLISVDTEGNLERPWSLQFSDRSGYACAIRANSRDLFNAYGRSLVNQRPRLVYHNALHDLGMMRALGLPTDLPFDDTMVMAYLLQVEPQGLKALCLRHCGMQMSSYMDLIGPASERLALSYLDDRWQALEAAYQDARMAVFQTRKAAGKRIKVLPKLPKSALHKAVERCLRAKDPRKLWADQPPELTAGLPSMPEATLDDVPLETAITYGCRDADGTLRLLPELSKRIDAMGLRNVYELELSTYPLIERMMYVGIKPDLAHFAGLSIRLENELASLQAALARETALESFNANSGDQVAAYLFDILGLEGDKRTDSGRYSTNDKTLEALEHEHGTQYPVIGTIRSYREYYKLKHTFVDQIPAFCDRYPRDGRIHATFRTTRVVTGRLAASDPNLLAMPKHGRFAVDFRRGWVPEPGHLLAEWDLSQIELRVLAHLSQDPVMLRIFREGKIDLHAATAERIFGVAPHLQDKSKHRLPAKAINFGIPMGMTAVGLALELRKNGVQVDEDDAQRWLDETLALYSGVGSYMEARITEGRSQGYVRCLSGRIRYIGGLNSRDVRVAGEAARFAFSTPIQEGAQYILKTAEAWIWSNVLKVFQARGVYVEPLIQIHDALTLEVDPAVLKEVDELMVYGLTQVPAKLLSVPIETSGDAGLNWADMGPIRG